MEQYFLNEKIEIDDLPERTSLKDYAHLKAKITHGQNGELFLKGNISSIVKLECVICLRDFEENYTINFSDIYLSYGQLELLLNNEEGRLEKLDVFFYKNNQIDTKEIARDILLSNVSPYPVCAKCNLAK
jgi:uncharacterized metal-binding protein YceD (DUF177 family)